MLTVVELKTVEREQCQLVWDEGNSVPASLDEVLFDLVKVGEVFVRMVLFEPHLVDLLVEEDSVGFYGCLVVILLVVVAESWQYGDVSEVLLKEPSYL